MRSPEFHPNDRVKVIGPGLPHYGRVGSVLYFMGGLVRVRFHDQSADWFAWDQLRNVTKRRKHVDG